MNKNNSKNLLNKYMATKRTWATSSRINYSSAREGNFRIFYDSYYAQPSLYYRAHSYNEYQLLVDPNYISRDEIVTIEDFSPSKTDQYLAYTYSRNGSDWKELKIVTTDGSISPTETLSGIRYSAIEWYENGFFYKKYERTSSGELHPHLYYHRIFSEQNEDSLIFKSPKASDEIYLSGAIEEDMYVLEIINDKKNQYTYLYFDPAEDVKGFRPLFFKINYQLNFLRLHDDKLLMLAPVNDKSQILSFDKQNPKSVKILSPEFENAQLTNIEFLSDKIVLAYQQITQPYMAVIDYDGTILGNVSLPNGVSVSGLHYQKSTGEFLFHLESYTIPSVVCKLNLHTYTYEIVEKTGVGFDFSDYKFELEYVEVSDSVNIPVFVIYKEKFDSSRPKPMLLETYSGFGSISQPRYNPEAIYFIEQGGVYAYAYCRGGGEKGISWWSQGQASNKTNTVNDFIGVSEYYKKSGKVNKIAITGSSHGGLITAAAFVQRPDLYAAAIIESAPLDMLTYQRLNQGVDKTSEYGSVRIKEDFEAITTYSPYHNIRSNQDYPPCLIVTGSNDDRVPPAHSFKFAALLQNRTQQTQPILLQSKKGLGHNSANNLVDYLDDMAQICGFIHEYMIKN